jgi:hypothetical protein
MKLSLYEASVPSYRQTLAAVGAFLDKGMAHFRERGIDPETLVETRLYPDMLPFRFQIQSVVYHSIGALEAMLSGVFRPPTDLPALDYRALQELIAQTREAVGRFSTEAINSREGADLVFEFRKSRLLFTTEDFLLSFSLPNFYFHATTAYDILRANGVPLGKRDYLGTLRLKA